MKKKIISLIVLMLVIVTGTCQAASYTLPEKMANQLAIGSGLKGTFSITTKGEKFQTPFLKAVSDAEFSIRGISSDKDFHYYVFQSDEQENQSCTGRTVSAISEAIWCRERSFPFQPSDSIWKRCFPPAARTDRHPPLFQRSCPFPKRNAGKNGIRS